MIEMLDYATVLRINAYFYLLMPLTIWVVLGRPTHRSFLLWCGGGFLAFMSILLISLRGVIGDAWGFVLAQTVLLASLLMLAQPLRMDYGRPWPWRGLGGVLALYALVLIGLFEARKGYEVATLVRVTNSAALVALTVSAFRLARHEHSRNAWFMVWGYGLFTVAMMSNAVMTWWREDTLYVLQQSMFNHVMGLVSLLTILLTYMGYLGLVLERTQRINVQLRQTQRQAQQWRERARTLTLLDRQRTLTVLANSLGHDILQHLTSTQLNLQHAQRLHQSVPPDSAGLAQALKGAQEGLERSARLLDRIRNFLKPSPSSEDIIDLRTVVHSAHDLLRQEMMYRRIDFRVEVPHDPVWVKAESLLVMQALVQLLRNAMQALDGQPKRRLKLMLASSAGRAAIEVRDTGPGFAADFLDRKKPFQAPAADVHHGLGLYMTQGILGQFGGNLFLHNLPAQGALVRMDLPLVRQSG